MKVNLKNYNMRIQSKRLFLAIIFICVNISIFSQTNFKKSASAASVMDSLKKAGINLGFNKEKPEISLSTRQAIDYLQKRTHPRLWHNANDPLRQAFGQLVFEAVHPHIDSLRDVLMKYPYDSLSVPWDKFYIWEPLKIKIPAFSQQADSSLIESAGRVEFNRLSP